MPDLSTVYLPPSSELAVEAVRDAAGDVAAGEAAASASASRRSGGSDPVLLEECRRSRRVRTFDVADAGEGKGAVAARRAGGKKPSSAPLPTPAQTLAPVPARTLEDYVSNWAAKKVRAGVPACHCELPFLTGAPKAVECRLCSKIIYAGEEIKCTVSRCQEVFHFNCVVKDTVNFTADSFRCPQHACTVCKQKMFFWRCGRCTVAAHTKCAPWPVIHLKDDQGSAICWRHPSDWLLQNENAGLTNSIEEVFCRLPLPYVNEDFNIDSTIRDFAEAVYKPPPYTPIRRNIYLIKKKRANVHVDTGCTNCRSDSNCKEDCECRGLYMSCSKNCRCSDLCTNKPFRKDKKLKVVKTNRCGWGAVALEPLEKGDFVIEYVGEVIDDATCEQRLWDMKLRGDKNFYMCEISKDFTIDATFKGNVSRFLNHSCEPNCKLEKWQVDGETRVGVFASRSIKVGEPLTYDYRFVHFGRKVKCHCGALNCQGYLGSQMKNPTQNALAVAAPQGQLHESLSAQQDSSAPIFKPMTHLLPWINCLDVSFNLRSKRKIDRLCWGCKRKRTSFVASSALTSLQTSVTEAPAADILSSLQTSVNEAPAADILTSLQTSVTKAPAADILTSLQTSVTEAPAADILTSLQTSVPEAPAADILTSLQTSVPEAPAADILTSLQTSVTEAPAADILTSLQTSVPEAPAADILASLQTSVPEAPAADILTSLQTLVPEVPEAPAAHILTSLQTSVTEASAAGI